MKVKECSTRPRERLRLRVVVRNEAIKTCSKYMFGRAPWYYENITYLREQCAVRPLSRAMLVLAGAPLHNFA